MTVMPVQSVFPVQATIQFEAPCPHGRPASWRTELVRVREPNMQTGHQSSLLDICRPVCDCDCEETP